MGKLAYNYTDSEDTSSSIETMKKKKFSILKYTNGNARKKKCKVHSEPEPEEIELKSRSSCRIKKLRGILKHDRERESSDDEEDIDIPPLRLRDRCLVGRVPRTAGSRARGGGVVILVRKSTGIPRPRSLQAQELSRRSFIKRLAWKPAY